MTGLISKKCLPCSGNTPHLMAGEIEELRKQVPEWEILEWHHLKRRFNFTNFAEALVFVNKVGALAESEGHHPDISFGWGFVEITLTTHAVDGLSENDFILASKIDLIGKAKKPELGPIIIGVNDIEKVKNFYLNVFEIEIQKQSEHYLSARLNNTHVELEEDSENRFPMWKLHNIGTYKNTEFIVPDISVFLKKVKDFGGKIINDQTPRPWGGMNAEIADPDGNIFLISQK